MNILAIDTATEACSVALQLENVTVSRFEVCPQQHSQRLLPMVDEVLKEAGVSLNELDLLAFGRGPGSFTGVRIATGMIQGLALGTGLKVAGVSTLEAMAREVAASLNKTTPSNNAAQFIAVASDARMGEVYFAVYKTDGNALTLEVEEQVCPPEVALEQMAAIANKPVVVAGTGWDAYEPLQQWLQGHAATSEVTVTLPNAIFMLPLARMAKDRGDVSDAVNVKPVYLRDKVTWKKLPGRE